MLKLQFCHLDLVIMCEQDLNKSNKKYNRYNRINNTGIYWADPQKMYVVKERKKRKEKKTNRYCQFPLPSSWIWGNCWQASQRGPGRLHSSSRPHQAFR